MEESKDKKQIELDPSEWTIIQYFNELLNH